MLMNHTRDKSLTNMVDHGNKQSLMRKVIFNNNNTVAEDNNKVKIQNIKKTTSSVLVNFYMFMYIKIQI